MTAVIDARIHWPAERRFYTGMAFLMLGAVLLGFSRTFFLAPWFPEAAHLAPPEPYFFYVHGVFFTAWILLLIVQPLLVANRRVDVHRKVGWFGAGLAAVVVTVGVTGALIAASRPGGFIGVPIPPLAAVPGHPVDGSGAVRALCRAGHHAAPRSTTPQAANAPGDDRPARRGRHTLSFWRHVRSHRRVHVQRDRPVRRPVPGADNCLGYRFARSSACRHARRRAGDHRISTSATHAVGNECLAELRQLGSRIAGQVEDVRDPRQPVHLLQSGDGVSVTRRGPRSFALIG